jgi:hypothetical protein
MKIDTEEKDIPHEETPQQHPTPSKRTLEAYLYHRIHVCHHFLS